MNNKDKNLVVQESDEELMDDIMKVLKEEGEEDGVGGKDDAGADDNSGAEDNGNPDETAGDGDNQDNVGDGSDQSEEKDDDGEDKKDKFHADSLEDLIEKTETKLTVSKVSCEPSPIFGPKDTNDHNKYKITLTNKNGSCWFYFWDSIKNTQERRELDKADALACIAKDAAAFDSVTSLEDFIAEFGYDNAERSLAQKSYDGCRKMKDRFQKLFDEAQREEFMRLANEY